MICVNLLSVSVLVLISCSFGTTSPSPNPGDVHGHGWETPIRTIVARRIRNRWATRTKPYITTLLKDYHAAAALFLANRLEHGQAHAHAHAHSHGWGDAGHAYSHAHHHAVPATHAHAYYDDLHRHGDIQDGGLVDGYHVEGSDLKESVVGQNGSPTDSIPKPGDTREYIAGVLKHMAKPVTDFISDMVFKELEDAVPEDTKKA